MREGGLSSSYDLKSFDGRLGLDKSAATRDVVSGSYGGDTLAFANMGVSNDRALANVFGSGENYAGFLTANMDKSVGQLQGEMGAYAAARSLGFNGNWREFNAMRSEVSALVAGSLLGLSSAGRRIGEGTAEASNSPLSRRLAFWRAAPRNWWWRRT